MWEFDKYFTGTYHWDIANKFVLQTRTIFVNIYYVYTESSFSFNTATPSDVCKTILQLKPTNSAGHDKMPKTFIYIYKKNPDLRLHLLKKSLHSLEYFQIILW